MDSPRPPEPIASLHSQTLDLPPACAQFCPAHAEYLVVGTYNLQTEGEADPSKPQSRNGSLIVLKLVGNRLIKVQSLPQPSGVLDLRFYRDAPGYQDVLAVVSSIGTLAIFRLDPLHHPDEPLRHLATSRCDDLDEDVLFLQCKWHPSVSRVIGITTSTGIARLLHLDDGWSIDAFEELNVENSLEAWCLAFSPRDQGDQRGEEEANQDTAVSIYCGGDDSMLKFSTVTLGNQNSSDPLSSFNAPYAAVTMKGQHDAGVTAILPLNLHAPDGGRVVITGSYDDRLRVFSIQDLHRSYGLKRTSLLADVNLGGGVWRLDPVLVHADGHAAKIQILTSCMYAGARLVEIVTEDGMTWGCNVLARFEEHQSMNYASDIVAPSGADHADKVRVVSTSFYDKLLCLWEYQYDPRHG